MSRVRILNAEFDRLTLTQAVEAIFARLARGQRGWLCTVNVAILMMMRRNPFLQAFTDRAALVVADGQPIVWSSRLAGVRIPERVTGVDLVDVLCERAAREGKRVYLLGSTAAVIAAAARELTRQYPTLRVDYADGYFDGEEARRRAERIAASRSDILFVAMGVPRQERFISEQWDRLNVGIAIGVGGTFDVVAGLRMRAPGWVQRIGLEWLFRLAQEPRRLFARYFVTNWQFLSVLALAAVRGAIGVPVSGEAQGIGEMVEAPAQGPDVEFDLDDRAAR